MVDLSPQPRNSENERDALLAWAITQLGGSIVLSREEQWSIFDSNWTLRAEQDSTGRLIVEAQRQ